MADINCIDLIRGVNPSCDAQNKVGGINKRVWIGQLNMLNASASYTEDVNGYVNSLNLLSVASIPYTLKKFIGKKSKNSTTNEVVVGENTNTVNQSTILALYYSTPTEREAIEALINADDVFVAVQGQYGGIEIYGLDFGLNCTAGTGGLGALLNDNTAFVVTLSGEQLGLPKQFLVGGTLANTITYLEGISQ
jgi:hypothetical protein